MKIPIDRPAKGHTIACPWYNSPRWWRHGSYTRTYFHSRTDTAISEKRRVQRYLCRASACERTFSVLPDDVVAYCRFTWSDLLDIGRSLAAGISAYRLARHVWHVGRGVITRARSLLARLAGWLGALCREISDGAAGPGELEGMAALAREHYGRHEFTHRWCRHLYPDHVAMRPPNTV
jgi:hypothetical protein